MGGNGGRDVVAADEAGAAARPALPPGRHVWLAGRGRTFVREVAGPPGAPVVMLLHGWTATADLNWWASFAPLAERFRVIAVDHRGHGRGLRTTDPFRLEDCADDIAALVGALGLGRVVPVGYSMGGPIAQLLWRRHPELVDGLVLCATSTTFTGTVRERVLFGVAAGTGAVAGAVPLGRAANAALVSWNGWRRRQGRAWWGFDEVVRHDWNQIIEAGRAIGRFDSRHWVGDIDVPTAIVVTDQDDVVPVHRQLDLADRLAAAAVWHVPGGHAVCTLAPELFVPALVAACSQVARRADVALGRAA
ncbi:MAG: alpha/beta hydrolase [Ilumatobacteraceae bacterium]